MTAGTKPTQLVVLHQVEGSQWCVVQHQIHDGHRTFVARIATACEYADACRQARVASVRLELPLAVQWLGMPLRKFKAADDLPISEVRR
jgi:hypothetical protein